MKAKFLFGITACFLSILNTLSFFIFIYIHSNLLLFPYQDIPDSRISNIVSGQSLFASIILAFAGLAIAILNFSISFFSYRKSSQSNQFIKSIKLGFIIVSVVAIIYFSCRLTELWHLNMSLGGDCTGKTHCNRPEDNPLPLLDLYK